ncbi:MAG: transcription regulator [Frankiales bacterium]|nr:transcription regulator [Frankiales bacterium]
MSSQRHNLLDAALACVMDVGLRRTTLADVARRAGVSRMTVYRAFPDLDTLVGALLTRELTQLLQEVEATLAEVPTARERLVRAAVETVTRMDDHPLYRRVLDLDPELLLPLVVDRFGSTQVAAMALIAEQVRAGHDDGSIRAVDPDRASVTVLLTAQSFVFSARLVDDSARAELAYLLEAYLR